MFLLELTFLLYSKYNVFTNFIILFSEKFVTAAYKAKMLEIQKQEEEEKLQDLKESIMDVTKQKDMSGFYK